MVWENSIEHWRPVREVEPVSPREREANYSNSKEFSGRDSTLPHSTDSQGMLMEARNWNGFRLQAKEPHAGRCALAVVLIDEKRSENGQLVFQCDQANF